VEIIETGSKTSAKKRSFTPMEKNALLIIQSMSLRTYFVDKKGKADPLQAWRGPEGSWKLRLPDFVTTAQDGGRL